MFSNNINWLWESVLCFGGIDLRIEITILDIAT